MRSRRHRAPPRLPYDHGEPIWRCRYDVIAGVLFAVAGALLWATYKNPTHAVTIDLLGPTYFDLPQWDPSTETVVNVLAPQADGTIEWNGEPVTDEELWRQLNASLLLQIEPALVFSPEPNASYDLSLKTIAMVRRSGVTKFCFGDLEDHQYFEAEGLPNLFLTLSSATSTIIFEESALIEPLPNPPNCSIPKN